MNLEHITTLHAAFNLDLGLQGRTGWPVGPFCHNFCYQKKDWSCIHAPNCYVLM